MCLASFLMSFPALGFSASGLPTSSVAGVHLIRVACTVNTTSLTVGHIFLFFLKYLKVFLNPYSLRFFCTGGKPVKLISFSVRFRMWLSWSEGLWFLYVIGKTVSLHHLEEILCLQVPAHSVFEWVSSLWVPFAMTFLKDWSCVCLVLNWNLNVDIGSS